MEHIQGQGIRSLAAVSNVRYADERPYSFCCDGVPEQSVISIGSYGCLRDKTNREYFRRGLEFVIARLKPSCTVVYGGVPDDVFSCCKVSGIRILHFPGGRYAGRRAVSA